MAKNYLKVYPANDGDSLMLSVDNLNILIDGGYVNTYRQNIKKDLIELSKNGQALDYLIVTHIDQDHISGIVKLIEENNKSKFIQINNIWHNSLKHIQAKRVKNTQSRNPILESISKQNYLKEFNKGEHNISATQGSTLAGLISEGNYNWNEQFSNKAICTENNRVINLSNKVRLILLSPSKKQIRSLNLYWRKELLKVGFIDEITEDKIFDDAFEIMISKQKLKKRDKTKNISGNYYEIKELLSKPFTEDNSASNGSSIAFVIEFEEKKLLFLGDAHSSVIKESLKSYYGNQDKLNFNLIKVAHHGSFPNNDPDLISMLNADKLIFSTNGSKNNHPDRETVAHFIDKNDTVVKFIFNYPLTQSQQLVKLKKEKSYNFEVIEGDGINPILIEL
ncbi:MBL fold metallo-hydrolase [Gillisia sp. CAL575]|uniref:MBL fold metallo-hydrolase n=1 Tax=Gillisia sp. CAL575 TaxID=985255 RepID=UPI0003A76EDD|nr:MBL fold metallo-hydrolase [Gillisia sp. CAL575]